MDALFLTNLTSPPIVRHGAEAFDAVEPEHLVAFLEEERAQGQAEAVIDLAMSFA